jgi:hypothetical protein
MGHSLIICSAFGRCQNLAKSMAMLTSAQPEPPRSQPNWDAGTG